MKTYIWNSLTKPEQQQVLARPVSSTNAALRDKTQVIIDRVKSGGDQTLLALTAEYDKIQLPHLKVSAAEFTAARQQVTAEEQRAIEFAYQQINACHHAQVTQTKKVKTCVGVVCERQTRPIERVGLYVPGGSAPLVSTVLMLGIPAQIAQCPVRVLCSPPNKHGQIDPRILFAAELCGIQQIYKVGGAQAVAAMAYGTQTIPKVDKIFGPGNTWVTQAKMLVAQDHQGATIDMPAGPSEVMVIADAKAKPEFVAADLLSQAEHGADSQVILVTFTEKLAVRVKATLQNQLVHLSRRALATQSLENSRSIIVHDMEQALEVSNRYAPEHLVLQVAQPKQYMAKIQNAGAVFLGPWTPETAGDYVTGSNHVLPTSGFARSVSGLSVLDFMKFINFQTVSKQGLQHIGPFAETLATMEGLDAHKNAITIRLAK